ncbi:unnamed protein product [Trypanosoma congolense IL3000]|uniref:WGS project CAEQ00000000 data, annotated contig 1626 n=1 Tax=Trypanosoma congolense (strain IL3000) TaxID=1068625 RepID=F9W7L5_TRYCI|nr:unnamed protein product [Trypanosoma congolense IL3000]
MPKIRPGMKRPPPGFEVVNDKLDEYEAEMRLALSEDPGRAKPPLTAVQRVNGHKERMKRTETSATEKDSANLHSPSDADESEKPDPPLWRVAKINRERTRYVYNACHRERTIGEEVLDYCCEMNFIDAGLVRRWGLAGYERLCCNACCLPGAASEAARMVGKYAKRDKKDRRDCNNEVSGSTCICRVPTERRRSKNFSRCAVCGCSGCGSGEKKERRAETKEDLLTAKRARTDDIGPDEVEAGG